MSVELVPAVAAGLAGGVIMLALQAAASAGARPRFDVLGMWATLLALENLAVGVVVHLGVSVAIAVLYALGFALSGATDAGWAWGLIGGVIHWIIAGLFLGAVPDDGDRRHLAPGPFAMRFGPRASLGFLVAHLAFGLVVGVIYFVLNSAAGLDAAI